MMAIQLSEHLFSAHNIRRHTSLLKPKTEDDFDFSKGMIGGRGTLDPMDI
jgi:hypothetical protein